MPRSEGLAWARSPRASNPTRDMGRNTVKSGRGTPRTRGEGLKWARSPRASNPTHALGRSLLRTADIRT
eukprot:6933777-Pyramimonas_sp.AAC.1